MAAQNMKIKSVINKKQKQSPEKNKCRNTSAKKCTNEKILQKNKKTCKKNCTK